MLQIRPFIAADRPGRHAIRARLSALFALLMTSLQLLANPLSEAEKQAVLDLHNQFRGQVARGEIADQPTATNMTRLAWNDDLEAVAQAWVNNCNWSHNPGGSSAWRALGNSGAIGENLFVTSGSNALQGVSAWFEEHQDYTWPGGFSADTGHYTQLVWADTHEIGCAALRCDSFANLSSTFDNGRMLVCNYHRAGNFNNQPPYEAGAAASNCPDDLPVAANGLCTRSDNVAGTAVMAVPTLGPLGLLAALIGLRGMAVRLLRRQG